MDELNFTTGTTQSRIRRQKRWSERPSVRESTCLLALKVGEGALNPGTLPASRGWKQQGLSVPPEPLRGKQPCQHLDFSP